MTSAFVCSHVSCMTHPFQGKGVRVVSSEEEGVGTERNCKHAHETEGVREWEHPSWLWGCTYMPASFCVLRNEGSTNYYSAAKLQNDRGRGDARLRLLFLFNICCFSCYIFFSVLLFFTDIPDGVAASTNLQTLWFGWFGFLWLRLFIGLIRLSFPLLHWYRSCRAVWLDGPMTSPPCSTWGTPWRAQSAEMTSQSCKNDSSCYSVSGERSATRYIQTFHWLPPQIQIYLYIMLMPVSYLSISSAFLPLAILAQAASERKAEWMGSV